MASSRYRRGRFTVSESLTGPSPVVDALCPTSEARAPDPAADVVQGDPRQPRRGSTERQGKVYKRGRFTVSCFTSCIRFTSEAVSDDEDLLPHGSQQAAAAAATPTLPKQPLGAAAAAAAAATAARLPMVRCSVRVVPIAAAHHDRAAGQQLPAGMSLKGALLPRMLDGTAARDQRGVAAALLLPCGDPCTGSPESWESPSSACPSLDSWSSGAAAAPPRRVRFSDDSGGAFDGAPCAPQHQRAPVATPPAAAAAAAATPFAAAASAIAAAVPAAPSPLAPLSVADAPRAVTRTYQRGRFQVEEAVLHPHHMVVPSVRRTASLPLASPSDSSPGAGPPLARARQYASSAGGSAVKAAAAGEQDVLLQLTESDGVASVCAVRHKRVAYFRRGRFLVQHSFKV